MPYKIIYIDDETTERSQAYADGLESMGLVEILVVTPTKFEELITELITKQDTFDALIIDLKLDGNQSGERTATYTAPSLASGIRSKCFSEAGFKNEFPIFLISSSDNLKKYYDPDSSSHDLFDSTFTKASVSELGIQYERLMSSFIDAYKTISVGKTNFERILNIKTISEIDDRIFTSKFLNGENISSSEISKFIFDEIIMKSGILIDEDILAARLGINRYKSENWRDLLKQLIGTKYTGVFSSSSDRWWAKDVIKWWDTTFDDITLIRLNASERLTLIKEKFSFEKLIEARQIPKTTSTKFWTICQGNNLPLDPKDGFLIDGNQIYPWQDKRYLSLESLLERDAKDKGLTIHPSEIERFQDLKKEYL